ncbi:uncharacterized protein EI90DRAFT_3024490 [Cantharellus anzutake]|uniref:uncharacterized protein n=1 Tax=Cantharellus anzutake TaxID=1750568 RepID=UPI001907D066|nr:uncharacterized protein EI90DRAFT_3024490 [Cantharellus anzutake]KAF8310354.1 hypothetical protein EI90DRAFT_3024490 [Cantharellus anzutake]
MKTAQKSARELDPIVDVGEADAAPIDPDLIGSPNAPPDKLDLLGVVADTEAPAAIAADLDNTPIDTETQSAARGTGPSAPVPLLPTMSGEPTGTNNPPVDKAMMKGDLLLSIVAPREDVPWRECIQMFVSFEKGLESQFNTILERLDVLEGCQELCPEEAPNPLNLTNWKRL